MDTQPIDAQLQARLDELEQRVADLETLLAGLLESIPARRPSEAHPGNMRNVINLIYSGETDAAQRELRRIPEDELAENPATVAIVAAALCAQRGEMAQALKALDRANALTSDERLLKVMEHIRAQLG